MIKRLGDFLFRYRNMVFPAAPVLLFLFSRPDSLYGEGVLDVLIETLGVLLVVGGEMFRLAVIGYAYIKRGGHEGKVYADDLVVKGFFAHSRNPLYLGTMVTITGVVLLYESWAGYLLMLPFFLFGYYAIVTAEETFLRKRFGAEYDEYCGRVNRFWPNFKGLKSSLSEFEFNWKRALRKDYGNIFQAMFALWAVDFKKHFFARDLYSSKAFFEDKYLSLYVVWFLAVVALYVVLRALKKSHRLASSN